MRFESIGDNCEFGLMQRTVGIERMGLLRYAGIHDLRPFVALLRRRLEGFCEGDDLKITTFGPEWMADIGSASLNIHSGRIGGLVSREQIEREERVKLQFLAAPTSAPGSTCSRSPATRSRPACPSRRQPDGSPMPNRPHLAV